MDLVSMIRNISLPAHAKLLLGVLLGGLFLFGLYLIVFGLVSDARNSWIQSSAYILGIVFPFIIIAIVTWGSEGGTEVLRRRTEHVLLTLVPDSLSRIHIPSREFIVIDRSRRSPALKRDKRVTVAARQFRGDFFCDYRLEVPLAHPRHTEPDRILLMNLQLNVRRANFVLFVNKSLCDARAGEAALARPRGPQHAIFAMFPHTIAGASYWSTQAHERTAADPVPTDAAPPDSYTFNEAVDVSEIDGVPYYGLVGYKRLASDFLWNPAERLFFVQDLMIMVRSFLTEQPQLFEEKNA